MTRLSLLIITISILFVYCRPSDSATHSNPPAEGFDMAGSDTSAMRIADEVMLTMGGRKAWDQTRYIKWDFFGRRTLTWDKHNKKCRIEIPAEDVTILVNLDDETGQAKRGDKIFTESDSLAHFLKQGKEIWINDSYWLVMPFKLKDSGVTLRHLGEDTTTDGKKADLLQLTFKGVGVTPQNKYVVYVDQSEKLVTQWDFYTNAQDTAARFSTPWADYQTYGKIRLSGNRGRSSLDNIQVMDEMPEETFTKF